MNGQPGPEEFRAGIAVQYASKSPALPEAAALRDWALAAMARQNAEDAELVIRLVDEPEGRELNRQYRHRDYATNVLSFPFESPPGLHLPVLGDLVICAPVVQAEAVEQGKALSDHWAHIVIHGVLHLLGYDHIDEDEALRMESLETELLRQLGHPDPYADRVGM